MLTFRLSIQILLREMIHFWLYIGRIGIDEWLRVPSVEDVFAIGDCSGFLESTGKQVLPALAQVSYDAPKYSGFSE